MTTDEFRALMVELGWSQERQAAWAEMLPLCSADTFRAEMARADRLIQIACFDLSHSIPCTLKVGTITVAVDRVRSLISRRPLVNPAD
jgi:hypothetical protein